MTPHKIEAARSGRSSCRSCKQKIANGALRLGVGQAQEGGGHSHQWLHLDCAAKDRFLALEEALADTTLPIPDRAALEQAIAASVRARTPVTHPYAVVGGDLETFHCDHCGSWSFPGTLRVLTPKQITVGTRTFMRDAQLHTGCANAYLREANLLQTVIHNSGPLSDDHLAWLKDGLT